MRLVATGLDKKSYGTVSSSREVLLNSTGVKQGQAIFFSERPDSKCFRFCGTYDH